MRLALTCIATVIGIILLTEKQSLGQGYDQSLQPQIDSLNTLLEKDLDDTLRIKILATIGEMAKIFRTTYWDSIATLAEQSLAALPANQEDDPPAKARKSLLVSLARVFGNTGLIYKYQGDISKALEFYYKSLKIGEEVGKKSSIANSLNNIAVIYEHQGNIPKALEYYHRCLKIDEEISNKAGIATALNNIAVTYEQQGDTPKALEYYQRSLEAVEELGNKEGIAGTSNNIGVIYYNKSDLPKGLKYFHKSLTMYEKMGNKRGIASSLNNVGQIYKQQGDIPKALEYYHKSLRIEEEIGNKAGIASSLNNIGHSELSQGALSRALQNGKAGLLISREIGSPYLISVNSDLLSKVAKKQAILTTRPALRQAKYKEALEMYELHIQMRDSIKNEETQKAYIRQQTKYEFEKAQLVKEQEEKERARLAAELTSRRDNLQYSVVLICLLILGAGLIALGRFSIPIRIAEGLIFFSFLIFFEFVLVLADPYIENWSGGAPGIKLLFNAGIAALIFPLHSLFETKLKGRLVKYI